MGVEGSQMGIEWSQMRIEEFQIVVDIAASSSKPPQRETQQKIC